MSTSNNIHVAKFKSKAKSLHRAVKANDAAAMRRIAPYFDHVTEFKLTQAQLVISRELHCSSWMELVSNDEWVRCSFCKKWQYEVKNLVAGPDVYVCDECVEFCSGIIRDNLHDGQHTPA
ncbi:MAG TPA: ClpX C4-type zinc finger protein [Gammaproteobacteria bacterium]|nr:ClpX C4-type zinc finger protein [Gammaproteobacteria bacterium]